MDCLGCFDEIFSEDGWDFHCQLIKKYGTVVRVPMLFGVSRFNLTTAPEMCVLTRYQDEQLYVTDPLALHHITVKDQYTYDETDFFYASVSPLPFGGTPRAD